MKFDWHTEEDGPLAPEEPTAAPTPNASRRLLMGLSVTAVILVATFAVYYQLNRRVDEAQAQIELDVLAAFNLAQQALAQGDAELLATVLSRRDPQWFREWQEVAESGPYPHIISPLLTLQAEPEIVSVTLSNELDEAEIIWRRSYSFRSDNGLTETIQLERTDFYYKTLNGWLWIRPPDDFWGGWETWHGRYLTLVYPARDAATAVPLAEALETHLDSWCQRELPVFMRCPYQPPWEMRLAVNPGVLVRVSQFDIGRPAERNWRFSPLPAPSIMGRPLDEAGLEALLHYYALQTGLTLVRHNLQRPVHYPSPHRRMQAVLWLSEAGLYAWPPPDLPPAPAALPADFVLHCPTLTGGGLWQYTGGGEWRPRLAQTNVHEFAPWPGGDGFFIGSRQLHKEETWVVLSRYRDGRLIPIRSFLDAGLEGPAAVLQPASDGRHLTLYTTDRTGQWDRYRLDSQQCDESGCPLTLLDNENWWENWSPDGRHGLRIVPQQNGPGTLWLTAGDGVPLREVGPGYTNAAWLNTDQFVYADISFGSGPAPLATYRLHLGRVDQDAPELTVTAEELFAAHGLNVADKWLAFGGFLTNPHQPHQLIVLTNWHGFNLSPNAFYPGVPLLFLLEMAPAAGTFNTSMLPTDLTELIAAPTFSRDGRHLVLIGHQEAKTVVELVDLRDGTTEQVVINTQPHLLDGLFTVFGMMAPAWSPDGRWLAMIYDGVVHFLDVETAAHTILVPPQPGCMSLAWLNSSSQ
jgi:hypothetical protein